MGDLCIRRQGCQKMEPPTIQIIGKLYRFMCAHITTKKYAGPWNPLVTIFINNIHIENILIDLGEIINILAIETLSWLGHYNIYPTPIVLELVDRSKIKHKGVLEDITISLDSWECPENLFSLWPK